MDNRSKACLDAPVTVFQNGETDLLTLYDCVGEAEPPCSSADSMELVAFGGTAAANVGLSGNTVFQPESVVVHIPDLKNRRDLHDGDLVWRTGGTVVDGHAE